jgi:hypothetical protein
MPVSSFGPRPPCSTGLVETWCQTCSSTPSRATPANRVSSSAARARIGWIERHTVRHVVPSCRASPEIEACSRRNCSIAHQHARAVSNARGAATCGSCSVNIPVGQAGSGQVQVRLRHRSRTGRPKHGVSISSTNRRP